VVNIEHAMLVQRTQEYIEDQGLIRANERIAVAFSGGPDSTALLLILKELFPETAAVYVNHNLREDSNEEEDFVRKFCANRNIALHVERIQWKRRPVNLEESARKRRYRHLEKVAKEHNFSRIALAHHQDDLVETMLLRLLRGTGPRGLPGMKAIRGRFIRPFLSTSRKEIQEFLKKRSVTTYSDPSNKNQQHLRNRIRNELLPYLEAKFNPAVRKILSRNAKWFEEQNALVAELIQPLTKIIKHDKNGVSLDRKSFLKLSVPIQKDLIREALSMLDPSFRLNSRTLENILAAIDSTRVLELSGFLMVQCTAERIHFSQKPSQVGFLEIDVTGAGRYQFPPANTSLNFSIVENKKLSFSRQTALLDADKAEFPLSIRNWKKGDFFHPLGMNGHKKLSDFWIDRKVARTKRKQIPLIFKDDQLVCVMGFEVDEEFKVTPKTRRVLKIERDV
jgi:tRNA(Ile)-lysidine synthase